METLVRQEWGKKLPPAYAELMKAIGKGCGDPWSDVTFTYTKVMTATKLVRADLLEEGLDLPDNTFVFVHRFDGQFLFFLLDDRQKDPPVYYMDFGNDDYEQMFDSVWDAFDAEVQSYLEMRRD